MWFAKLGVASYVCGEINPSPAPESSSPSLNHEPDSYVYGPLKTRPIPYWTTSVFPSTAMNDESLLTQWTALNDVCLTNHSYELNYGSFITYRRPEYRKPPQTVPLLFFFLSAATKRSNLLLSNWGPIVDCVTSRICLQKHCLANGHIPSNIISYIHYHFSIQIIRSQWRIFTLLA
jgi:hypothetical protein